MMRHIVLFRRLPHVPHDPTREAGLIERMSALGMHIPAIQAWRIGANELIRPISWDYVLESQVAGQEELDAYLRHPLHQALVADLKTYFEWAAVDYTA